MWGTIGVLVDFLCLVAIAAIWIRMSMVYRRHGIRVFAAEGLLDVPKPVRRPLMRTIRRGEPVPPEYRDAARQWARVVLLRRDMMWTTALAIPLLVDGMPGIFDNPGPWWRAGFWLSLFGLCMLTASVVLLRREQRVAARLFRDTDPFA